MSLNKHKKGLSRKQEQEVQRLQQSWFKTTCFVFYTDNISGWPYQPSPGLQMLLNICGNHNSKPEFTSKGFKLKWIVCLSACLLVCFFCYQVVIKLMFTQYIAFGPPQKAIRKRPLLKHKNGCAAPISKVEHIIHNFKNHILVTWPATNLLILRKWCGFEKPNHYSFV